MTAVTVRSMDSGDVGPRSVTVRVPAGLPEVMADPALMERVIVNLARNALRYSPAGTPPLLTARARGGRVELRVIDRGPGIPRTERNRAFLPFQRLGDTAASPGVGLGLALSRGLTEAMGGTLDAYETPGGGLTMVISLPAARRTARAADAARTAIAFTIARLPGELADGRQIRRTRRRETWAPAAHQTDAHRTTRGAVEGT